MSERCQIFTARNFPKNPCATRMRIGRDFPRFPARDPGFQIRPAWLPFKARTADRKVLSRWTAEGATGLEERSVGIWPNLKYEDYVKALVDPTASVELLCGKDEINDRQRRRTCRLR